MEFQGDMNVEDAEKGSKRVVGLRIDELFVLVSNNDLSCLHQKIFHSCGKSNATVNTLQH